MHRRLLQGFYLDDQHIDPRNGRVSGPGGTHRLTPKTVELLLCLATRAPALVMHEEILSLVWANETTRHDKLSHAVSELRQALGDEPGRPRFIQTLPKRGYRLLVEPTLEPHKRASTDAARVAPTSDVGVLGELRRRGVVETGIAYLVMGWLLIQVAGVTSGPLSLPEWVPTFVTYLIIVGFPIALVLAWFIELTPRGAVLDVGAQPRPARRRWSNTYAAILGALALASTGVFVYDRYVGLPGESRTVPVEMVRSEFPVQPNSIAVLPFRNIGDTEEGRIFGEGLAEDIIDRLTRIPALHVSSRGDSFTLPPNSASSDVRRRLRVAYYLEGSIRIIDDTLRVAVQLIDSDTGFHLISRRFDREREDFFTIQDEVTNLTVANLRVALPAETRAINAAAPDSTNVDAYVLYRRGMDALYEPRTAATIQRALEAFAHALAIDPGYAAAHAGMCMGHVAGHDSTNEAGYIAEAERSCAAALDLNPNLDVVHDALGNLYARTGRYEDAAAAFERALAVNMNAVSSLIGLGNVYMRQQRLTEAEATLQRAIGLQPGNWNAYNALGAFLFLNGRYEEAAKAYRGVVSLDEENMTGWVNLAASSMLAGDFEEGARATERSIEIQPTQTAYSNLGLLYYYLGDIGAAVASLEQAVEMAPNDYLVWSNLGDALSFSATPERAEAAFVRAEALAEAALQVNARDGQSVSGLAWIKAMLGKYAEAERLVESAHAAASGDPQVDYIDALILAARDRPSAAVDKLETAVEMGYPRALIAAEPHLRRLRGDARFEDLIGESGQAAR